MPGTLAATLLLAVSLAANPPSDVAPQASGDRGAVEDAHAQVERALREATAAAKAEDLERAAQLLDHRINARGFERLPEHDRYRLTLLAGHVAAQRERHEEARRLLQVATAFDESDQDDWFARTDVALALGDLDDASFSLTHVVRTWPKEAAGLNEFVVHRLARHLVEPGREAACRRLLEALFDAGWTPAETLPDSYWSRLSRLLLADGAAAKALEVARRIDDPREIALMRVDRRFDALAARNAGLLDVERAIRRTEKKDKEHVRAASDRLAPLSMQQANQIGALQPELAIAGADRVIALVRGRDGGALYKDFDTQYVWILDQRAEALAQLGRWDEAVRQREQAARRPERGEMNVSQVINLAELYNALGRARDAREAIAEIGPISPYGRMQLEMVRLQAAVTLGDREAAESALAFLRDHRSDAIGTWQYALVVDDDLDGAAALLVERLGREDWRSDALADVQDWAETARTPILVERAARWKRVRERPEVKAAIARVGRIERFPLAAHRR